MPAEPADRGEASGGAPTGRAFFEEYWGRVAVAPFLLITVDMLTTMFTAAAVGPDAEANTLMRWALGQGTVALVAVNVLAAVLAVGSSYGLREILGRAPGRHQRPFPASTEAWSDCWRPPTGACSRTRSRLLSPDHE